MFTIIYITWLVYSCHNMTCMAVKIDFDHVYMLRVIFWKQSPSAGYYYVWCIKLNLIGILLINELYYYVQWSGWPSG